MAHSDPECGGCPAAAAERGGVGGGGVAQLGAQPRQELVAGAVLALGGQHQGGPAFVDVPDALERLDAGAQAEQRPEPLLVGGVLQGLVAGEHGLELDAVHEGGEDEVDEAALVATTAPVVEPLGRVLVEGAVAAAKGAVVLREARRTVAATHSSLRGRR